MGCDGGTYQSDASEVGNVGAQGLYGGGPELHVDKGYFLQARGYTQKLRERQVIQTVDRVQMEGFEIHQMPLQ